MACNPRQVGRKLRAGSTRREGGFGPAYEHERSGIMFNEDRSVGTDPDAQHSAAVQNSLAWADEAAQAGEYDDALKWLAAVEAVGTDLSTGYRRKRELWEQAAAPQEPARSDEATITYLHCPRCRLAIARKVAWLGMTHCPRCVARDRVAVQLFSSTLPPDKLYAERRQPLDT